MRNQFSVFCLAGLLALFGGITPLLAHERTLQVRVEDGSGNAVHQAEVSLYRGEEKEALAKRMSGHEGEAFFEGLPAGELLAVARMAGYEPVADLVPDSSGHQQQLVLVLLQKLPEIATEISVFGALPLSAASSSALHREEFQKQVIDDTADILRSVPGLTVVQHGGGGKANQFLIRGFDADHGTDFALSFAGIPVNMVSHAHGQGYTDLNFVIPEMLESIEVYKGPYFAELGNLATAGAAVMRLRESFDQEFFAGLEGGSFETGRFLAGFSPRGQRWRGYALAEGRYSNGPFEDAQAFRRLNLATRWTFDLSEKDQLSLLATSYQGRWNQSGQIPLREVEAGRLSLFGSVDPSEGGRSRRINFSISHQRLWSNQVLNSQFYWVHYDLDLFSNFTFFAQDPLRGDGILQSDDREVVGGHLQHHIHYSIGKLPAILTSGFDWRQDFADVGLFRQQEREVFGALTDSGIRERNLSFYLQQEFQLNPALRIIAGLRHDRFRFGVRDRQSGQDLGVEKRSLTSPKASLLYSPQGQDGPHFFANYGQGFHSNDARSVVTAPQGTALAQAVGYEAGYRQLFGQRLEVSLAYWWLDLDGELVFVGDEGTTELRGPTHRHGPEAEVRWRISPHLWLDAHLSHSQGRFRETDEVIARAPRLVGAGGISFLTPCKLSGNLRLRHIGQHPLVEDNSVQAKGYTVADLYLDYPLGDRLKAYLSIENLLGADIREAQTFFESRLPHEPQPMPDTHFTPGNPFTIRFGIRYGF